MQTVKLTKEELWAAWQSLETIFPDERSKADKSAVAKLSDAYMREIRR